MGSSSANADLPPRTTNSARMGRPLRQIHGRYGSLRHGNRLLSRRYTWPGVICTATVDGALLGYLTNEVFSPSSNPCIETSLWFLRHQTGATIERRPSLREAWVALRCARCEIPYSILNVLTPSVKPRVNISRNKIRSARSDHTG